MNEYIRISGHRKYAVREHTVIVEKVLGKRLPSEAEVHHVDGNKSNNSHSNLVVCPDIPYHKLLHRRTEALAACGNANWIKCRFCKQYDAPENLTVTTRKTKKQNGVLLAYHRACNLADQKRYRA